MLSAWSVLAFALVASAAPNNYGNYGQKLQEDVVSDAPNNYGNYGQKLEMPTVSDVAEPGFDCSDKEAGAHGEGCGSSYWLCWKGVATSQECPTDLWFNMENGQCDYKSNVVECGGVVTTTSAIVSDNATPKPVDFDCSGVEDGQHAFKNGEICQPKFVSCVGGIAWEMACPDGLMFDPDQMLCLRIEAIIACGGTPEPETTTYSYQTTLAAEPTTIEEASYGSYQAPAVKLFKPLKPVSRIEKPSYQLPAADETTMRQPYEQTTLLADLPSTRSYQQMTLAAEPTTRLRSVVKEVKPVSHIKKASYSSYQTEAPILAAEPITRRRSFDAYQTEAPILAAEPITRRSFDAYQTEAPILAAEPVTRRSSFDAYPTKLPILAEPTTRRRTFDAYQTEAPILAAEPVIRRSSFDAYQTEAPILAATRLLSLHKTKALQTTTPLADDMTLADDTMLEYGFEMGSAPEILSIYGSGYGSLKTPAAEPVTRRQMKTTLAADQSYGSYETATPAAEPTTRKAYGSYQAPVADATPRRLIKSTRLAALTTPASYGYETPAAEQTTRRHIETTLAADQSYGSYQAPAVKLVKPLKPVSRIEKPSYQLPAADETTHHSYKQTTLLADLPTTRSYKQTTLAAEPTTRLRSTYGSKKIEIAAAPALKSIKNEY